MTTIFDLATSANTASYYDANERNRQPYFGESLFPNVQQLGLKLDWIKGAKGLPAVLKTSAFDVNVINRPRQGFDHLITKMPFMKESMQIDEETRQDLNILLQSGNKEAIDMVMKRVFDDNTTLLDAASAARERMRMMALTTGVVSLNSNGQAYTYDYSIPSNHKITVTNKWSNATTSTPIDDIRKAQDIIEDDTGNRPVRGVLSRKSWYDLLRSEEIKKSIYVFTNGVGAINDTILNQYLMEQLGLSLYVNTKKYKDETLTQTPYIADGVVSLFPEGALGKTVFGTTPEQSDLMSSGKSDTTIVDTGVAVTAMFSEDPVRVETKVSQICLPSFESADEVAILSV